jgi:hypothetical protein
MEQELVPVLAVLRNKWGALAVARYANEAQDADSRELISFLSLGGGRRR